MSDEHLMKTALEILEEVALCICTNYNMQSDVIADTEPK